MKNPFRREPKMKFNNLRKQMELRGLLNNMTKNEVRQKLKNNQEKKLKNNQQKKEFIILKILLFTQNMVLAR